VWKARLAERLALRWYEWVQCFSMCGGSTSEFLHYITWPSWLAWWWWSATDKGWKENDDTAGKSRLVPSDVYCTDRAAAKRVILHLCTFGAACASANLLPICSLRFLPIFSFSTDTLTFHSTFKLFFPISFFFLQNVNFCTNINNQVKFIEKKNKWIKNSSSKFYQIIFAFWHK